MYDEFIYIIGIGRKIVHTFVCQLRLMQDNGPKIKNNVQDRSSAAWKKLCDYVDKLAEDNSDDFSPLEFLGQELYFQIYTLPESISKLKSVKKIWLYGSKLKRIPPEIGQMTSLEYFDVYTSYDLRWIPYEITHCKNLKGSRMSTRAVFGNYKNRKPFPSLIDNPVRYDSDKLYCSVCGKEISYSEVNQVWISLYVATDVMPLLVNLCSAECESRLPAAPGGYIQHAHKGGLEQKTKQPGLNHLEYLKKYHSASKEELNDVKIKNEPPLIKFVKKGWEK